ncbi:MAG: SUMF1/EgtB/PvdO family nonheme iron enzyme [Planctomycetes bacterium]|nr:SUMF1/EgtB/PvdO family nonheme iron enzyme [Planctomycetota bacterium]
MSSQRPTEGELHRRAKEVFAALRRLPGEGAEAELAQLEAREPEVAREVRELLKEARDDQFLAGPFQADAVSTPAAPPVRRIAGFKILAPLGRGGMGVVYLAEQEQPQRRVALKLLRREIADSDVSARFRREIEVLGRLQHPGIARIYEAGVTSIDGAELPWYAMEFVEGRPLLEHARRENLAARERVALLAQICEAVEAAHVLGIVHRDLKPDNVLVEASGRIRVLDFGVAAVVKRESDLTTLRTATGELVGTISYMSPEQASGGAEALDRRSDVYALGVMLFELLTGELPCATRGQMLHEAVRAIREDEATSLSKLRPELGRELAAVVGKALEKERDRRYDSAIELGRDLRRWLADEPVHARAATPTYRLGRLVRRHRVLFGAIGFALISLSGGLVMTWAALGRARAAESAARDDEARTQRLSDLRGLELLESRVDGLWPATPERLSALQEWLVEAERIVARRAQHHSAVEGMRANAREWPQHDIAIANALVARLDAFQSAPEGALPRVRARAEFASSLEARTIDAFAREWRETTEFTRTSPRYGGLELRPQVGLVPLGADPDSGLVEFALYGSSGEVPRRASDGRLAFDASSGIVLVLVPGGTFRQGGGVDDVHAYAHEVPPRSVTLRPFFISKFEITQAQWLRITGGNPSYHAIGESAHETTVGPTHPVEFVSWPDVQRTMQRIALELPTEAQWEFAARGGSDSCWFWGSDESAAHTFANVCKMPPPPGSDVAPPADAFSIHAPVGSFEPNPFGLYDVAGNVSEWCRDPYKVRYLDLALRNGDGLVLAESEGDRSIRGGSWAEGPSSCRSAFRTDGLADWHTATLGVRPVRDLR